MIGGLIDRFIKLSDKWLINQFTDLSIDGLIDRSIAVTDARSRAPSSTVATSLLWITTVATPVTQPNIYSTRLNFVLLSNPLAKPSDAQDFCKLRLRFLYTVFRSDVPILCDDFRPNGVQSKVRPSVERSHSSSLVSVLSVFILISAKLAPNLERRLDLRRGEAIFSSRLDSLL